MAERFKGKVVIVTGAATGIGRAAALGFAAEGGKVLVADRDETEGAKTAKLIAEKGGSALFKPTDVASTADVKAMVATALSTFGGIDIAFNNAGIGGSGFALVDEDEATFDRMIAINLKGVFLSMKYEIEAMLAHGKGGTIVNTASVAGLVGNPGLGAYCAAKHGVVGLTRALALELAKKGVTVNAVCPGFTDTPIIARSIDTLIAKTGRTPEEALAEFTQVNPQGRLVSPEEVANTVLWLASPGAGSINGQAIAVAGGEVMAG
jgi:NAD(P)-dependent dehydrogenase (short-subunit alcohol dehydrogenase family)